MTETGTLPHVDAQKNRCALSPGERAALSLLREENWSWAALSMCFEVDESTARNSHDPDLGRELQREAIRSEVFGR